jgi:hypothetical protein
MERRFIWGLTILLLALVFAIGTGIVMKAIHSPGEAALTQAAELALSGDMERAVPLAQDAYTRWQKYRSITAAFADHNPMDDTERLFREMMVYAETDEVPHFAACCRELARRVEAVSEAHRFSWWNVL